MSRAYGKGEIDMKMLEKLLKRIQEGKKDNKGFSLVELIIVIAIMAILIGIVGMNVIPQIENARKATDAQVLSAMVSEAMEAYTQVEHATGNFTITVTVGSNGAMSFTPAAGNALQSKFSELADVSKRVLKSTAGKGLGSVTITCDETDGVYIGTVASGTYTPPTGFDGYEFRSR